MRALSRIGLAVLFFLVVSAVAGAPQPAHASCSTTPNIETALERANSVFVGEVTALEDRDRLATMKVVEVWKGRDLPERVVVEGYAVDADTVDQSDRRFQMGRTYLVESRDVRPPFQSDKCTATKLYNPLGGRKIPPNLAGPVGADIARPPLASPGEEPAGEGGASWLPFLNIGLVVLGIIAVVVMYNRVTRVESRAARQAAAKAEAEAEKKPDTPKVDKIGKVGRRLSLTGAFGRSGLQSSRRLRGRKTKEVSSRSLRRSKKS